ncbi:MAG: UvrB/UvrC motif-containing protein [Candidatus Omnitrophota bacterium]|jgi:protein arginine kinase activator
MLCDICGKIQATVHLTEIVDDQMSELHLCEDCARNKSAQMEQQFGLSDILAGMADFDKPSKVAETLSLKCPNCGLTYAEFKKIGRLGCGDCYAAFRQYLAPLLKRIHGSARHSGKLPEKCGVKSVQPRRKNELQELRQRLLKAVEQEDFEEAARLRDSIRELEEKPRQQKDNGGENGTE